MALPIVEQPPSVASRAKEVAKNVVTDFEKVQELVEDAGLSRILRQAKRQEANAPTLSLAEVKKRLGSAPKRARKSR